MNFVTALSALRDPHGMVLIRHGRVIAEASWAPYRNSEPHVMFSLSKSFTSSAIGFAVSEGLLTVDDRVVDLLTDDVPTTVDGHLADLRVRHLLTMTTGHAVDSLSVASPLPPDLSWAAGILGQPFPHQPGSVFVYNSGATYLLSAIITKLSGVTLFEYLAKRLFVPLGIENATWSANDEGINHGGWGLSVCTEDAAKLGLLYLQGGRWEGQQLLAEQWTHTATREHARGLPPDNPDWLQGYGYQFWRCQHGFYRADGAFGQYSIVMAEHDAVLALTSGVDNDDLQSPLNVVWSELLPAFHDNALPEDSDAQLDLRLLCKPLEIARDDGHLSGAAMVQRRPFVLRPNDGGWRSLTVDVEWEGTTLRLEGDEGATQLQIGHHAWLDSSTLFTSLGGVQLDVRSKGAWQTPVVMKGRMSYNGSPFTFDFELDLGHGAFRLVGSNNVGFGKPYPVTELQSR